jgi:5-hydroxyisourate hydrolase
MTPKISTHVLDTAQGQPAPDVPVRLERQDAGRQWRLLASAHTDRDGRCAQLLPENETLAPAVYRLVFDTAAYFAARKLDGLYPFVEIVFHVRDGERNFHIPLLLSPNGYTTYRGS